MSDVAELKQLIIKQYMALGVAGKLLAEIAAGKSAHSDEAMSAFSHVVDACKAVNDLVNREAAN
jgi:hypothetical protein